MTVIENLQPRVQYNYSTASQLYNITFPYIEKQYVKCMVRDQVLEYNTHYQVPVFDPVSLDEDELYLTLLITPNADLDDGITIEDGDLITIYRETPIDQQAEFPQTAKFSSQKITEALDKLTLQQQEQQDDLFRCLKLAKNVPDGFETSLPVPVAKNYIRWSDDGTQLINYDLEEDMNTFKQDVNDAVEEFEEDVNETLTDFQGQINTIRGTANEAVSIANGAVDTADEALETAETAESNSQTAINTANTASSNASSALSTASTAVGTANTALTKANAAVNTANTADTNASSALTKANQAITDSTTALSTAEDAAEEAESATDTAEDALDKATTALSNSNTALSTSQTAINTANTASTNASTALTNSQTAVNTANSASTKVDEFGEDIEQVIEAAEKINELEEAVETAVEAASDATTAATNATTAATNATTAAATATQKAQEAAQAAASIVLDTYRVVYNTTTYTQVTNAISDNKIPILDAGNNKYGNLVTHYTSMSITIDNNFYDGACFVFHVSKDNLSFINYYLFDNNDWVYEIINMTSTDIINTLGYTPYNSTNPAGYTSNIGTVVSINSIEPDSTGNITLDYISKEYSLDFNVVSSTIPASNWYSLTYGNNKFVALGNSGHISTTTDGINWTTTIQVSNLGNNNWQAIAYGANKYVALGLTGYISTSTDGDTWDVAAQDSNLGSNRWRCLVYDGTKFIALSNNNYISFGSVSGTTLSWSVATQSIPTTLSGWTGLAYGNNKLVAIGTGGKITISTDGGTTWSEPITDPNLATIGTSNEWRIFYKGTKFVAIKSFGSNDKRYVSISSDGLSWTIPIKDNNIPNYTRAIGGNNSLILLLGSTGELSTLSGTGTTKITNVYDTLSIDFGDNRLYNLLDGETGKIPNDRLIKTTDVITLANSGTLTLTDNTVYKIENANGAITFTLPTVTDLTVLHRIEIELNMSTAQTIDLGLGSTPNWFNATELDLSEAGTYNILYQYSPSKSAWYCGGAKIGSAS